MVNPLNKKDCDMSFEKVEEAVSSETTLIQFKPFLPIQLATDASPVGFAAIIFHRLGDGSETQITFAPRRAKLGTAKLIKKLQ